MSEPKVFKIKKIETHNDFKVLQDDTIRCANCNSGLVQVIKVKENPKKTNVIIVECPFCNDTSFRYKIDGDIYISGLEFTTIVDFPVKKIDDVFYSTIKVAKNG